MNQTSNRFYSAVNPLLGLLAAFNIALTLYCCTQFYAYLPTSDVWVHVDFLVRAAQGHLDIITLFEKHNGVHLLVLPKLVYFLDIWLTHGSGVLTVIISFLAQLASVVIVIVIIKRTNNLDADEAAFWGLVAAIILLSACQVESFLNPANLQWSLLVFAAILTGWFVAGYAKQPSPAILAGILLGVALVGLCSASIALALLPLSLVFLAHKFGKSTTVRAAIIIAAVLICLWLLAEVIASFLPGYSLPLWFMAIENLAMLNISTEQKQQIEVLFSEKYLEMYFGFWINWITFNINFYFPPLERLHIPLLTNMTGIVAICFLFRMAAIKRNLPGEDAQPKEENYFFAFLLLFSMTVIMATAIVRFYDGNAFTFRFVNVGLLFSLGFLFLMFCYRKQEVVFGAVVFPLTLIYLILLTYVNITEAAAFGYGRNLVRLNQVAYAVNIEHAPSVSALPGTVWEKSDYDFVEANKHKLKESGIGIYQDKAYEQVGKPVSRFLDMKTMVDCSYRARKFRRLSQSQRIYRLGGITETKASQRITRAFFVDAEGVVRGFAIPVLSSRSLWGGEEWSGFANLESLPEQKSLQVYAYGHGIVCAAIKIDLPAYEPFVKKEKNKKKN